MIDLSRDGFDALAHDDECVLYRARGEEDGSQAAFASRLRQAPARLDSSEMQSAGCGHEEALAESGSGASSGLGQGAVSGRLRQAPARLDSSEMQSAGCGHEEALAESGSGASSGLGQGAVSVLGPDPAATGRGRVLILVPAVQRPRPEVLKRLEHEYSLREELDREWAVRPLTLNRRGGQVLLVLEDPSPAAASLDGFLKVGGNASPNNACGQPMELGRFFRLAINLAAGLEKLHRRGLIHKDIKPAHILVDFETDKVWFTGFGISSRLARERQAAEPPEVIAGTLAYMAPEQTGRMNRSIDSRSDLYSLGVTFYQMLTGALPFSASDPMDWVHCHLARQPVPPAERRTEVPDIVSAVVMKLLAKTAEERYQTAAGLEADLRRCLDEYLRSSEVAGVQKKIPEFPLGQHDTLNQLVIPEKLYGREREVEALHAAFDRVAAGGGPELILVGGRAGAGKSAVVHELHRALAARRSLFASGKFDQHKHEIPLRQRDAGPAEPDPAAFGEERCRTGALRLPRRLA